ncbi:MAG: hypothetical protein OXH57_10650 [Ekhidna sp.]|nr:hypothetical protein [Ekhidna sp.]
MATGARDAAKDINLNLESNAEPYQLWSDGTTLWVMVIVEVPVGNFTAIETRIYAYVLATGVRDASKDFDRAEENDDHEGGGLWSDGTTIWVTDDYDDDSGNPRDVKIYAYTLAKGIRSAAKEFDLAGENENPTGIWSDGTTLWVADHIDKEVYAYQLK